jgi:hypothetical protein
MPLRPARALPLGLPLAQPFALPLAAALVFGLAATGPASAQVAAPARAASTVPGRPMPSPSAPASAPASALAAAATPASALAAAPVAASASNPAFRQTIDGFTGLLVVTVDPDWKRKWDTPSGSTPNFKQADTVKAGQRVSVLSFFSNPKLSAQGRADVTCELTVMRPDGSVANRQADAVCFRGPIPGDPKHVYLSEPVIDLASDEVGRWTVRVVLKDNLRNVAVPLEATFLLEP